MPSSDTFTSNSTPNTGLNKAPNTGPNTELNTWSPLRVGTLMVAAVSTAFAVAGIVVDHMPHGWAVPRDVSNLLCATTSVGWVGYVAAIVRDDLVRINHAHHATRDQAIAAAREELAVVQERQDQLARALTAMAEQIGVWGDGRETDGRISAIREVASKVTNGASHGRPRTLRPAGPAAN